MLLTITYSGQNTADLGYLLHKNPFRPQRFDLNWGAAYVFYPCVSEEKTTAALLLDIDPVDLARGKAASGGNDLFDYVNDRPYVASSFLSVAIAKVFGTAMTGRADSRQELSDSPLDLRADIAMLPCRGDRAMLARVFVPLGYETEYESFDADERFPAWGESRYVNLRIKGRVRLRDLLKHLYVLLPVFDRQKHYWVGDDEVEKLLRNTEEWLSEHPEKKYITGRYLKNLSPLVNKAFRRLAEADTESSGEPATEETSENPERRAGLNARRLDGVIAALKKFDLESVIDMGCGEGRLLRLLEKDGRYKRIAGMDVSHAALEKTCENLKLDPEDGGTGQNARRVALFQGSLTYRDSRCSGYDAACVVEVIEHLDLSRLDTFARVLFEYARPKVVVITTPNREYNVRYENVGAEKLRHGDHRFEWTRAEFQEWAGRTAEKYGYAVEFSEIGDGEETLGAATQMGVFSLCA